jgi:hypothetical protein
MTIDAMLVGGPAIQSLSFSFMKQRTLLPQGRYYSLYGTFVSFLSFFFRMKVVRSIYLPLRLVIRFRCRPQTMQLRAVVVDVDDGGSTFAPAAVTDCFTPKVMAIDGKGKPFFAIFSETERRATKIDILKILHLVHTVRREIRTNICLILV